jgi:hypothetical protein
MRQPTIEEGKEVPVEGDEDEENQKNLDMPVMPTYSYICIRVSYSSLLLHCSLN